jgi:hypothetical protein
MEVEAEVNGVDVRGFLDTGSDCSSVSLKLATELKLELKELEGTFVSVGIHGKRELLKHWVVFDLKLKSSPPLTLRHSFLVHPNSPVPLLLGRDFMYVHRVDINRMGHELQIGDYVLPFFTPPCDLCNAVSSITLCRIPDSEQKEGEEQKETVPQNATAFTLPVDSKLKTAQSYSPCTIPAGHEVMVEVAIPQNLPHEESYCMEGTLHAAAKGLIIAASLVDHSREKSFARIMNPTAAEVELPKGFPLGIISPVTVIDDLEFQSGTPLSKTVLDYLQNQEPDTHPDEVLHCMHNMFQEEEEDFEEQKDDDDLLYVSPDELNARLKKTEESVQDEVLAAESPKPSPPDLTREQFLKLISCAMPTHINTQQQKGLFDVLYTYSNVFSKHKDEVGHCTLMKHSIPVIPGTEPIALPPRRFSPQKRKIIREIVQKYKEMGIVRDSKSPWSCPVVLVMRKDGSARLCCDWRKLNDVTIKDKMPLPLINDVLDGLGKSKWFTKLDFTNGYYHIDLDEDAIQKSAFVTAEGLYEFTKMGMGLVSSPATFVRMVSLVLGRLLWTRCMAYLDDVLVYSATWEQHLFDLGLVLAKLLHANLKLKPTKCSFASNRMDYLGFIVDKDGLHPDPAKTEKMVSYPRPKDVKTLQQFLGLVNYYRKFVPHFASIARPLYKLLEKQTVWNWDEEAQTAFENLKTCMASEPVLAFPDFSRPFIISTDASGFAISCILKQLGADDPDEHVIQFGSKALNKAQRNYSTIEREALAIKYATVLFWPYLQGNKFTVYTDHKPLTSLLKTEVANARLAKWRADFMAMDMKICYRPGKDNADADALSRITSAWEEVTYDSDVSINSSHSEPPSVHQASRLINCVTRIVEKDYLSVHTRIELQRSFAQVVREGKKSVKKKCEEKVAPAANLPAVPFRCFGGSSGMMDPDDCFHQNTCQRNPFRCFSRPIHITASDSLFGLEDDETPLCGSAGIPSITAADLIAKQREEKWMMRIISLLDSSVSRLPAKTRRHISHYELVNNILYRKVVTTEIIPFHALVIPSSLRAEVLFRAHDLPMSGHLGVEKTWRRIRRYCFWPGMYKDVLAYVLSCRKCNLTNTNRQPLFGSLQQIPPAVRFFQRVHMDKVGPVRESDRKNSVFFVAVDACTRWKIAAAFSGGRSMNAAEFLLHHVILKFGPMEQLVTDNGPENIGPEVLALLQLYNISHIYTSTRVPQTNGLVEVANGSLSEVVRTLVKKNHHNWDILLPHAVSALNTAVHDVTGFSPHFLVFGQEPHTNHILPMTDEMQELDSHTWEEAHAARELALRIANERTAARYEKSAERYNQRHRTDLSCLKPGQKVYVETEIKVKGLSKRFTPRFSEPVTIVGPAESPVVFWVQDEQDNQYRVHCKRMKLCFDRPTDLIPERFRPATAVQNPPSKKPRVRKEKRQTTITVIPEPENPEVVVFEKKKRGRPKKEVQAHVPLETSRSKGHANTQTTAKKREKDKVTHDATTTRHSQSHPNPYTLRSRSQKN